MLDVPRARLESPSGKGAVIPRSRAVAITALSPTWLNRRSVATLLELAKASASVIVFE